MDRYTKIEIAREILNLMIAKAAQNGFDQSNKELMRFFALEKELKKFNMRIANRIIRVYGPQVKVEVKQEPKLTKLAINTQVGCKNCENCQSHEICIEKLR